MAAAVYVDRPDVRFQLQIRIQDSCNWCCCRSANADADDDTKIYINHKGHAVRFDPRKAEDELAAMERSVQHLNERINLIVEKAAEDQDQRAALESHLKGKIHEVLAEAPASPRQGVPGQITVGMVERINRAIAASTDDVIRSKSI